MYNKSISYNFWDFITFKCVKDKIGSLHYRRLEDKLDIKNFIKLQKKVAFMTKILFNKNSKFIFKLLTKTYQNKEHFNKYFIKKVKFFKVNLEAFKTKNNQKLKI